LQGALGVLKVLEVLEVLEVLGVFRVLGVLRVLEFQAALPLVSCAVGTCFSVSSLKQRSGETARRA
jgi:hypothetical protein